MGKVLKFDVCEAADIYDKSLPGKRTQEVIREFCQTKIINDKMVCRYSPKDECGDCRDAGCPYIDFISDIEFAVRDDTFDMVAEHFYDCLVIEDE